MQDHQNQKRMLADLNRLRMILKDVHHVLNIRLNLKSARWLDNEGYNGKFRNGTWKFYKGNLIMACARKQNTLYVMHAGLSQNEVNVASESFHSFWGRLLLD